MVYFKNFCCGYDLKTGGVIIGLIGIITSIIGIIIHSIILNSTEDTNKLIYLFTSLSIGKNILYLILNMGLLWGAHKCYRLLLVPWLFTVCIMTPIAIFTIVICGGIFIDMGYTGIGLVLYLVILPQYGLTIYFWCCVYSLFIKLRREELEPNISVSIIFNTVMQTMAAEPTKSEP